MRASVQQARADTCSTCLLFIQQRAQGTCQLATIAHCAMSCQGQQEQCASHPALSNKARSGIRCRTCVLLCAGRSACVSWAQVMVSAHSPAGDGQGSFTLTMVPVLTSLGNVCTSASLLSSCHKNYFGKNASPTVINSKPARGFIFFEVGTGFGLWEAGFPCSSPSQAWAQASEREGVLSWVVNKRVKSNLFTGMQRVLTTVITEHQ